MSYTSKFTGEEIDNLLSILLFIMHSLVKFAHIRKAISARGYVPAAFRNSGRKENDCAFQRVYF